MIITMIFILINFLLVNWKLKKSKNNLNTLLNRKLSLYLLVFIISELPGIYFLINNNKNFNLKSNY